MMVQRGGQVAAVDFSGDVPASSVGFPSLDDRTVAELMQVERRLIGAFGTYVGPDVVSRCVRDAAGAFQGATVLTYVPLLVERRAKEMIRAAASTATAADAREEPCA